MSGLFLWSQPMDEQFTDLARLVGKVLARRWLNRKSKQPSAPLVSSFDRDDKAKQCGHTCDTFRASK